MASSNTVSSSLTSRDYHCKVCNLYLDSLESLEVHLQYHKENLYVKWGTQNIQNDSENNNSTKVRSETTVSAPADSSDNMITKPSPDFQQRATPETSGQFPHPATPQSYHSAPSPYQNADQTTFSPGTQYANNFSHSGFPNAHSEQINWESTSYNQDYKQSNRFHPYNIQDRVSQVSSSSPIYGQPLNQPTPSPSPNQCDKCGFVCDSVVQLNEHCNSAHAGSSGVPNTVPLAFQQFTPKYNSTGTYQTDKIKEEQEESSDILDLDSHKVVYQGNEGEAQNASYDEASSQVRDTNTRTVPIMPWEAKLYNNPQVNGDVSLFKDQKMFSEQKPYPTETKMYHGDQKFGYSQDKFLPVHGDQKFLHVDQKLYSGVQMPPLTDYAGSVASNTADLKPPYRPYDSPNAPQITSTQPPNQASAMPSIGSKGANWKSNEARRPKTYNCTACNKWFTSSGHLKRHYNTTLHKNAVRSSGQPDPATMPISTHHHPSRDSLQNRSQQQNNDSSTQSPVPVDEIRGVDEGGLQTPYSSQNFERSHRVGSLQSKSQYSHLSQGNIENNFSNNPLANHSLQHQVGSHPINIGSQPPGLISVDNMHHASKGVTISSNPPNGEAGPSVTPNHHMRDLLSVSTSNIITPVPTQNTPALTAHPLPPFSHLGVNPYSPRSTDPLGPSVPNPTPQLFINQNFQQSIAPSYPNAIAPHVTDMATSNQLIASPATSGESVPQVVNLKQETSPQPDGGRLPSFSQFHTHRFDVNSVLKPNVGGQFIADDSIGSFIFSNSVNTLQSSVDVETQNVSYELNMIAKSVKDSVMAYNLDNVKGYQYNIAYNVGGKPIKTADNILNTKNGVIQILKLEKIENVMDYANKENYGVQMTSPSRPESANSEESNKSSNGVAAAPLTERNLKKTQPNVIHKCYECDKLFNKACYLTQHNKTFHSGAKPFKCDRCGKRFSDGATFESHYLKHAHDKPFKCPECPKSFNHKTDLRRHMCLHSGSKPFKCVHCGKGFIRQDHMMKHFETHKKKNMRSSLSSSPSLT